MKRWKNLAWLLPALGAVFANGCVERRFVITTHLPGMPAPMDASAIVYDEKGQPISATPADRQFTYYGKYRFVLKRDGYQTLVVEEQVKAPWYEVFPLDFISENLIPWTIPDVRRFHYELQPLLAIPPEAVLEQGQLLRAKGQSEGVPLPGRPPAAPVPEIGPPPQVLPTPTPP